MTNDADTEKFVVMDRTVVQAGPQTPSTALSGKEFTPISNRKRTLSLSRPAESRRN